LEAKINKTSAPHIYCSYQSDWFKLWLYLPSLIGGLVDCWADNIKLI